MPEQNKSENKLQAKNNSKPDLQNINDDKPKSKPSQAHLYAAGMQAVFDFAVIIAAPLIVFLMLGKWAAQKYGFLWLPAASILAAIVTSGILMYKKILQIYKTLIKPG